MIFQVINNWCLASGAVKARTSILGLLEGGNYRSRVVKASFIPLSNNHRWIVKNSSECWNSKNTRRKGELQTHKPIIGF